jgi:D-alanyl-D-alanine carboxypeptidase (penicillin-binding protein 5/6)
VDSQRLISAVAAALSLVGVAVPTTPALAAEPVKCPIAAVSPPPNLPRPSPMPPRDANLPTFGGELLETGGLAVPPGQRPLPTNLSAKYWLVADLDSGEVLGACGPHQLSPPASVQKLLLAQAVMPKLDPKQVITVTAEDLRFEPGSSAVGLILNGKYSVETLWLGLMLNSGNDAANVLARLGGGAQGVRGGLAAMNAEARRLGALDTFAATPSGLDGPNQRTTAYDLALIARANFARADFRRYVSTQRATIPAQPPKAGAFQIQNDNRLLTDYPGAMGGKTGFTDLARHTFVGYAQRNGRKLVVTLLAAERLPQRSWQQGAALLDWGFSVPPGTAVGKLVTPDEAAAALAAPGGGTEGSGSGSGSGSDSGSGGEPKAPGGSGGSGQLAAAGSFAAQAPWWAMLLIGGVVLFAAAWSIVLIERRSAARARAGRRRRA